MIDHFYTDLDGTLFSEGTKIPKANLAAIREFQARGGKFGFATGRMPSSARKVTGIIHADLPLVYANGAIITDGDGRLLRMLAIRDREAMVKLCKHIEAAKCGFLYTAYGNTRTGAVTKKKFLCEPPKDRKLGVVKVRVARCKGHDELLGRLKADLSGRIQFVEVGDDEWKGVSIAALGVGKDKALLWVSRHLKIPLRRMAFIGDSGNDVAAAGLFHKLAGRCFVVANGVKALKAVCPNITGRNNHHGAVAEALKWLMKHARQTPPRPGKAPPKKKAPRAAAR